MREMVKTHHLEKHTYRRWSAEEKAYLWAHPEMTAAEIGARLGRSEASVSRARDRFGRWKPDSPCMCACCGERVVWEESARAARMRLCKGCYLREMRMRQSERGESNAERQRRHKEKVRRARDGGEGPGAV